MRNGLFNGANKGAVQQKAADLSKSVQSRISRQSNQSKPLISLKPTQVNIFKSENDDDYNFNSSMITNVKLPTNVKSRMEIQRRKPETLDDSSPAKLRPTGPHHEDRASIGSMLPNSILMTNPEKEPKKLTSEPRNKQRHFSSVKPIRKEMSSERPPTNLAV